MVSATVCLSVHLSVFLTHKRQSSGKKRKMKSKIKRHRLLLLDLKHQTAQQASTQNFGQTVS